VRRSLLALSALVTLSACSTPDPRVELEVTEVESYWAIDAPTGQTQFIAPVVRLHVHHRGAKPHRAVSATATFTRKGETQAWSTAYHQVSPAGKSFAPGETRLVVLKPEGEGRYSSPGAPEAMFQNPHFKDVHCDVFLRIGAGNWIKFAETDVERRIGPRGEAK